MDAESKVLMACEKCSWPKHRESVIPTGPSRISSLLDNRGLQIRLRLRVRVFQCVPCAHARLREAVTSTRSVVKISSPS